MKSVATFRTFKDGKSRQVYPYHVSFMGLEKAVLCRDDEDYSVMVKFIAICAWRKDVFTVIYTVVSNHAHVGVLAASQQDAEDFANEVKRCYSIYFEKKYGERKTLKTKDVKAIWLDTLWYERNAYAYIVRNCLDNGAKSFQDYLWTGYGAMFREPGVSGGRTRPVSLLTRREKEAVMHTCDNLSSVPWLLDENDELVPSTFCDSTYLEQVFNNDVSFFLKTIGVLDKAQLEEKLDIGPRTFRSDSERYQEIADISRRWFSCEIATLPMDKKIRLLKYVYHTMRTTVSQLARLFQLNRVMVEKLIEKQ